MDAVKFIEERRRMYKVTGKRSPTLAGWIPALMISTICGSGENS